MKTILVSNAGHLYHFSRQWYTGANEKSGARHGGAKVRKKWDGVICANSLQFCAILGPNVA